MMSNNFILIYLIFLLVTLSCSSISVINEDKTSSNKEAAIPEEALEKPPVVVEEKAPGKTSSNTESSSYNTYETSPTDERTPSNQLGWRVQIYNTDKKIEAESFEKEARKELGLQIYSEYEPPYYKLRVGNCKTPEEAEELLERVKEHGYDNAWIVQCRIIVK